MKYIVTVQRTIISSTDIEIEADDEDQAGTKAVDLMEKEGDSSKYIWEEDSTDYEDIDIQEGGE
jgi:hypothetical protein